MSNGRNKSKRGDLGRDAGGFVALPWTVMDCPAYSTLSPAAKALLFELGRQFVRDNNGRLLLSTSYLRTRGWFSAGVVQKAKQELLDARFIFEMVKGHRPNKASWYAVSWRTLDDHPNYDAGAKVLFERGAYRKVEAKEKRQPPVCKNPKKNGTRIPPHGTEALCIVPAHGIDVDRSIPTHGTVKAFSRGHPVPPHGNHLEEPSPVTKRRVKTA